MQHDFLELDEFVAEATKTDDERRGEIKLLPMQEQGLTMGSWAMRLDGAREGRNPLTWRMSVFYIYDRQDFIAMSAIQGADPDEEYALAQESIAKGMRRGREYSPEVPAGELVEAEAFQLVPISEDQAREIQFYDYKLPIIFGMCDWFESLIDEITNSFVEHGIDGATAVVCPQCGDPSSVRAVTNFTANGGFVVVRTETGYTLTRNDGFTVQATHHAHLVCMKDECEYNECIDLNEFEIDDSGV